MAIFKAVVRRPRKDGFWQVYIRVGVGVKVGYIATDKYVCLLYTSDAADE